jgi:hypothetical protein
LAQRVEAPRPQPDPIAAARAFAVAYATYSWQETPELAARRAARFATRGLATELVAGARGGHGWEDVMARHESAAAVIDAAYRDDHSDGAVVTVVLLQTRRSDTGSSAERPAYVLHVLEGPGGWLVAGIEP